MTDTDGNTSGQTGVTTETTSQTTEATSSDQGQSGGGEDARLADFQSQLERYDRDALRFAEKLHERVYHLRQRAQEAEAKLPKDGMAVIKADDVDLLKEYKRLGTPNDIAAERAKLSELRKFQMVSEAAQVAGMNPKVLSTLLPSGAELEIGEATDEDGTAKQTVVMVIGEEKSDLATYAQSNWSDFLPALKAGQQEQQGQAWIQQQASNTGEGSSNGMNPLLKKKLEQARERALPK